VRQDDVGVLAAGVRVVAIPEGLFRSATTVARLSFTPAAGRNRLNVLVDVTRGLDGFDLGDLEGAHRWWLSKEG
jgi:hypothetical protein